jgi:hypothetical protein
MFIYKKTVSSSILTHPLAFEAIHKSLIALRAADVFIRYDQMLDLFYPKKISKSLLLLRWHVKVYSLQVYGLSTG